jgi:putative oxidoreductase
VTRWLNQLQPVGIMLLRIVLGVAMVFHGYSKVVPAGGLQGDHLSALNHWAHIVQGMGLPRWLGYVSALTEFVGGIFLILGLLTRFCAFLVTVNMLFAIAMVNIHKGYAGAEYSVALAAMAFLVLVAGPGKGALDRRLGLT